MRNAVSPYKLSTNLFHYKHVQFSQSYSAVMLIAPIMSVIKSK